VHDGTPLDTFMEEMLLNIKSDISLGAITILRGLLLLFFSLLANSKLSDAVF